MHCMGGGRAYNTRTKAWVGTGQRGGEELPPFLPVCRGSTHLMLHPWCRIHVPLTQSLTPAKSVIGREALRLCSSLGMSMASLQNTEEGMSCHFPFSVRLWCQE